MQDYEIEIDDSTAAALAAIAGAADKDAFSLARIAEIDPDEFLEFMHECGEIQNEEALELLHAARSLRAAELVAVVENVRQKRVGRILTRLKYLVLGGGIGGIAGLLFAQKPGYELRGDIADATRQGIDRSREAAQELAVRAGEYYQTSRRRDSKLYQEARERASDSYSQAAEKVGDAAQMARETATRQTSTVAGAIDAGKKAYQEEQRKGEMSGRIEATPKYREKAD